MEDALWQAADCLEEAIAGRVRRGDAIPVASRPKPGQHVVPVPATTALKAALHLAMRESRVGKTELARRLGCDEKAIRRLLDPRHGSRNGSRIGAIQDAIQALGKRVVVGIEAA